jgi:hypothetical protein
MSDSRFPNGNNTLPSIHLSPDERVPLNVIKVEKHRYQSLSNAQIIADRELRKQKNEAYLKNKTEREEEADKEDNASCCKLFWK